MASNMRHLICTIYIISGIMLSRFRLANSEKCTEYYTLFEENICDSANSTKIKPALINYNTWNISKYMPTLNTSLHEYPPEDCFFELICDDVETACEYPVYHSTIDVKDMTSTAEILMPSTTELLMPSTTEAVEEENSTELLNPSTTESVLESKYGYVESSTKSEVIETTTIEEEDTIEPECKQLFTYIEVKTCNGGNSTTIKPVAVKLEMYSNSSISQYTLEDDPSCPFVPLEYQFAQLMCEEVTTECVPLNMTAQLVIANSTQNTALIAVGAIGAVGAVSVLTYYGYIKITEFLQSATYRLPQ